MSSSVTQDHVREIVREENKYVEKALEKLAESMEKMVGAINELTVHSNVIDEKFTQVHTRIDTTHKLADQVNTSVLDITTRILPDLESTVAVNSWSTQKLFQIAIAIVVPLTSGGWFMLERFNSMQSNQTKIMVDAIKELLKAIST